jgi:hypothetical protein
MRMAVQAGVATACTTNLNRTLGRMQVTKYGRLTSGRRTEVDARLWSNFALSRSRVLGKSFLQVVVTSVLSLKLIRGDKYS